MSKKKVKSEDKEKDVEINIESEQVVAEAEIKQPEPEQIKEEKAEDFEQKYNELNDKYLRLSAEFDNFRRRNLKERMELIKTAGEDILINILPVMDNFERALKAIENNNSENTDAIKEGVMLIYTRFKDFLLQKGIKEIEATGLEFNTDLHEALTKIPAPTTDLKGKVIEVVEKGYLMHEKVIRFAKVVVGE